MNTTSLFPRWIKPRIAEAMADTPVVLLAGPRQAGKTTLVRQVAENGLRYLTLDDELTLLSAREDPVGMIRSLDRAVIDEIQRAPALLLAIKKSVDERKLADLAGDSFKMGVLLYDGDETLPLGDGIWATPLSTLWGM